MKLHRATILALALATLTAKAGSDIVLAWDFPAEELPILREFRLYASTNSAGPWINYITTKAQTSTQTNLQGGKIWYFTCTAVSTSGLESDHSNVLSVETPISIPTNLRLSSIVTSSTQAMRVTVENSYTK